LFFLVLLVGVKIRLIIDEYEGSSVPSVCLEVISRNGEEDLSFYIEGIGVSNRSLIIVAVLQTRDWSDINSYRMWRFFWTLNRSLAIVMIF
jgi:hypothetical protein